MHFTQHTTALVSIKCHSVSVVPHTPVVLLLFEIEPVLGNPLLDLMCWYLEFTFLLKVGEHRAVEGPVGLRKRSCDRPMAVWDSNSSCLSLAFTTHNAEYSRQ